jgi:hypothetical protein
LRRIEFADDGQRADGRKAFCIGAGLAHLAAAREADHAERRIGLAAFADHVEIAHLEDAQGKHAAGEQNGTEREQWQ